MITAESKYEMKDSKMNDNYLKNNKVFLMGEIKTAPQYSHSLYGEGFYEFFLAVKRLSGQDDVIPVTVSERIMGELPTEIGAKIAISGQFRSYNKLEQEHSKLMLTVFVRDILEYNEEEPNPNYVELNGYVCKPPIYRTTPFNREICDVLLAVNRGYNKSDYIPCIAWGRNARFVKNITVGENIIVTGRIQSRNYNKRLADDSIEVRTAYELSVSKIMLDGVKPIDDNGLETAATTDEE